jgi:hypothetical protein
VARWVRIGRFRDGEMLSPAEIFRKEVIPSLDKELKSRKNNSGEFKIDFFTYLKLYLDNGHLLDNLPGTK